MVRYFIVRYFRLFFQHSNGTLQKRTFLEVLHYEETTGMSNVGIDVGIKSIVKTDGLTNGMDVWY